MSSILKELLVKACYSEEIQPYRYYDLRMQIGQDVLILEDPLLVIVSFLDLHLFHGGLRSSIQFPEAHLKLSTEHFHLLVVNYNGFSIC